MTYPAHEVRLFVVEEFREAQDAGVRRVLELRRIKSEKRAFFFRLGWNHGFVAHGERSRSLVPKIWFRPLVADPKIQCECGRIFHHRGQLTAHRWHCR